MRLIFLQTGRLKDGDAMKDLLRTILLIAVGLVAAIAVYPFLHEMGHTVATLISGTEVVDIQLWPLPSTLCRVDTSNQLQVITIGFGGVILPFLLTVIKPPKRFLTWYLWFVIKGICILSFVISLWAIIFYQTEFGIATDDMTRVMQFVPQHELVYLITLVSLLLISVVQAIRSRPIRRCMQYFDV